MPNGRSHQIWAIRFSLICWFVGCRWIIPTYLIWLTKHLCILQNETCLFMISHLWAFCNLLKFMLYNITLHNHGKEPCSRHNWSQDVPHVDQFYDVSVFGCFRHQDWGRYSWFGNSTRSTDDMVYNREVTSSTALTVHSLRDYFAYWYQYDSFYR